MHKQMFQLGIQTVDKNGVMIKVCFIWYNPQLHYYRAERYSGQNMSIADV